ncbi:MAG: extracellular solute-binding protein [Desulfobacterales bacterium]|nr:extracellular solute-binding protein [Desulfobacterales bacterium]
MKKTNKQGLLLIFIIQFFILSSISAEELRILCWEGYAAPEYTQEFEKLIKEKYKIDLKVSVKNVSDPQEFFDGIRTKKVDIISPAQNIPKSSRWRFIETNLVLPINLDNLPNYKDIIPALQKAEYISKDGNVYGVPYIYGPYGLAYNTNIVKEEPKSWNIFWDPQYAGKYSLSSDYHEANIYITALAMGLKKDEIFSYNKLNTPDFKNKLNILGKNVKSFWIGVDKADDLQGLAIATAWGFAFPELKKRGEVWKMAQPQEGATGWVDNFMIGYSLKDNTQMKRIAEEWLNFAISPEIQLKAARNLSCFPVNLTVKDKVSAEEAKELHLDNPNYFKDNLILWEVLGERDQNGFKNMWENAKK